MFHILRIIGLCYSMFCLCWMMMIRLLVKKNTFMYIILVFSIFL